MALAQIYAGFKFYYYSSFFRTASKNLYDPYKLVIDGTNLFDVKEGAIACFHDCLLL